LAHQGLDVVSPGKISLDDGDFPHALRCSGEQGLRATFRSTLPPARVPRP
jgi:hypothetical protein